MFKRTIMVTLLFAAPGSWALAAGTGKVDSLKAELAEIKAAYEARIKALEGRIDALEQPSEPVVRAGEAAPATPLTPAVQEKPNDFNPAIGVVLVGTAASFSRNPDEITVPGFMLGEESDPGNDGFSIGESEFNANANIDDKFYGNFTLSVSDGNESSTEVEVEEAWFQTLTMPWDLTLRGGRFFSGIGYRNEFHAHADDFADRSLAYRVFLNSQYRDDGVQLRWLAPTDQFLEFGAEWLRGANFPAGGSGNHGKGVWDVFARTGGDIGFSQSWKAGVSWTSARAKNRESGDDDQFNGDVDMAIVDAVWKWAPDGNPYRHNAKIEGSLFWQNQNGDFSSNGGTPLSYDEDQWGGYINGIYQFRPQWRAGVRYSWVDTDDPGAAFNGTALDPDGVSPKTYTAMLDWSNSEFSRIRLQYTRDDSSNDPVDRIYLQYILSMGAHGAHQF